MFFITKKSNEDKVIFRLPENGYELLDALLNKEKLPHPSFVSSLKKGIDAPANWKRPFRNIRNRFLSSHLPRKSIKDICKHDIIILSNSDFLVNHAKFVKEKEGTNFYLCSFWEWFALTKKDRDEIKKISPISNVNLSKILNLVNKTYKLSNLNFTIDQENRLSSWLIETSQYVKFYLSRLRSTPSIIPKTLWYGSVNNWWTRMLRVSVKDNGGINVGHDHGRGLGLIPNYGEDGVCFDLCDYFYSYSKVLSELKFRKKQISKIIPDGKPPEFN